MNEELMKALAALSAQVGTLAASVTEMKKQSLDANAIIATVKPHSDAMRTHADNLKAAGIGLHATHGHASLLHRMANHMDAEAAMGRMPHIYTDHNFLNGAGVPTIHRDGGAAGVDEGKIKNMLDAAAQATDAKIKAVTDALADITTKLVDLKAAATTGATPPPRVTLTPDVKSFLDKHSLTAAATEGKLTLEQVDKALEGLPPQARTEQKLKLMASGALQAPGRTTH